MKHLIVRLFLLLLATYSILSTPMPVSAADISIVVSPPRTDIDLNPGATSQKTIKVTNTGTTELILDAQVYDFLVNNDEGTPIKVTENASGRFLASPWFTLDSTELVIPPKDTAQIIVQIAAPKDALPGGHYAGVYFTQKNHRGEKQTISYTTAQVGSLYAINISGDINYDAVIKNFSTSQNTYEFGPVDFSYSIENQSDTHIHPISSIEIYNMLGVKLATLTPDSINIFPFSSRTTSTRWNSVWGFGQYKAKLVVTYGPGLTTNRDLNFWILPYRLIAAILVVFLVLLATIISVRRHLLHISDIRDSEIDALKRKIAEMENNQR